MMENISVTSLFCWELNSQSIKEENKVIFDELIFLKKKKGMTGLIDICDAVSHNVYINLCVWKW